MLLSVAPQIQSSIHFQSIREIFQQNFFGPLSNCVLEAVNSRCQSIQSHYLPSQKEV